MPIDRGGGGYRGSTQGGKSKKKPHTFFLGPSGATKRFSTPLPAGPEMTEQMVNQLRQRMLEQDRNSALGLGRQAVQQANQGTPPPALQGKGSMAEPFLMPLIEVMAKRPEYQRQMKGMQTRPAGSGQEPQTDQPQGAQAQGGQPMAVPQGAKGEGENGGDGGWGQLLPFLGVGLGTALLAAMANRKPKSKERYTDYAGIIETGEEEGPDILGALGQGAAAGLQTYGGMKMAEQERAAAKEDRNATDAKAAAVDLMKAGVISGDDFIQAFSQGSLEGVEFQEQAEEGLTPAQLARLYPHLPSGAQKGILDRLGIASPEEVADTPESQIAFAKVVLTKPRPWSSSRTLQLAEQVMGGSGDFNLLTEAWNDDYAQEQARKAARKTGTDTGPLGKINPATAINTIMKTGQHLEHLYEEPGFSPEEQDDYVQAGTRDRGLSGARAKLQAGNALLFSTNPKAQVLGSQAVMEAYREIEDYGTEPETPETAEAEGRDEGHYIETARSLLDKWPKAEKGNRDSTVEEVTGWLLSQGLNPDSPGWRHIERVFGLHEQGIRPAVR